MTDDKGILIKNIYYMLTYAFQVLRQTNYDEVASEEFEKIQDLFAAILAKGVTKQLKQGLYREYVTKNESLPVMRGKLDVEGTINNHLQHKKLLACEYDDLSENNIFNQVLKTTSVILIRDHSVAQEHRHALKKVMLFFDGVDALEPTMIQWNRLNFRRNNRTYEMLMNICYFVLDGLLQTTEKGRYKMASFSDQHMNRLYEKFILEYYRCHHRSLHAEAAQVEWSLDGDEKGVIRFLPIMQTDITLRHGAKILIIDAKYYAQTMQSQYSSHTIHSNNLYQIFTYVKNQDAKSPGKVAGMLLYAKTGESITPDYTFKMGGNLISVKTLDLNTSFAFIAKQLDGIAETYFAI